MCRILFELVFVFFSRFFMSTPLPSVLPHGTRGTVNKSWDLLKFPSLQITEGEYSARGEIREEDRALMVGEPIHGRHSRARKHRSQELRRVRINKIVATECCVFFLFNLKFHGEVNLQTFYEI